MKQALIVIDYIKSCCFEEYRNPMINLGLSKVRNMAPFLEKFIADYRANTLGETIWVSSCPWLKGYVHLNIERLYEEIPEAQFYSNSIEGNDFYVVQPEIHEQVFEKNLYSAFSGTQGKLDTYLRDKNIEHLIVSGIYSTGCVNATICEAFHNGYKLTIIKDCVETFDDEFKQEFQKYLLLDWSYMYGMVLDSTKFIKKFSNQ